MRTVTEKRNIFACAVVFCSLAFFSCAGFRGENVGGFVENFDPVPLESTRALRMASSGLKPVELYSYFLPDSDIVEIQYGFEKRSFFLLFDRENRRKLFDAASLFFALADTDLPAEYRGSADEVFFTAAVLQTGETVYANYFVQKGKLYFVLGGATEIYFTEAQLELLLAAIDADLLQEITESLQIDTPPEF